MKLNLLPPAKSLTKAYLKQSLKREQVELFKPNLARLFDRVNEKESEENLKNIASDFLKDSWYKTAMRLTPKSAPSPTDPMCRGLRRRSTGLFMTFTD